MSEAVIVAIITGIFAVIGNIIITHKNTNDLYVKLDKQSELADQKIHGEIDVIKTEITQLKQAVEKHNQVIERTRDLEIKTSTINERVTAQGREIGDLKKEVIRIEEDR